MDALYGSWLCVLLILLLLVIYWYLSRPRNLPPGTAGIPILGYLPFINRLIHLTLEKLGKKYGSIFHVYLGSRLVIILNDYPAIYEAFVKKADVFAGRPADNIYKEASIDYKGIGATDGDYWKQHHRFILSNLRDYGFGKMLLEPKILDEIDHFLKELRQHSGKSHPIKRLLMWSTSNIMNILVTGKRFEYDDPLILKLHALMKRGETSIPTFNLSLFFPWIAGLPGSTKLLKRKIIRDYLDEMVSIIAEIVQVNKNDYKDGSKDNYIHAYMTEHNARMKENGNDTVFHDTGLLHITRDLFTAGSETTSTTLHYSLFYMTLYPEIQRKVQNEIDLVIGRERQPSHMDRTKMIYTEATIMEINRIISLAPLGLPRRNTREVWIQGHRIPKDTMIIANLWAVHHDPKLWGDPENFRPERFIGADGNLVKTEHLIPFSIGKRECLGEPLAKMELFLYFVSLFQQFYFVPPDGVMPSLDVNPGVVIRLKNQNICAILRDQK